MTSIYKGIELDREDKPKNRVIVRLNLPTVKSYKTNSEDLKEIVKKERGTMAVRME